MDAKVKVGISGLGRSGWGIHANSLAELHSMYKVEAVCEPIAERRQEAVSRFGCKAYSDFDSLIGNTETELIVIATPSYLHASHTIKALRAGKKVVCEKPMAVSLAEADAMIAASNETGTLLTIFSSQRYDPDFLKVRELVDSGKLGRIVLIKISNHSFKRRWDWQTLKKFGGGELRNNSHHLIDQAFQLIGPHEPEIFCDLQRTLTPGDAEDHVKIVLRAPGSPVIDIEVTQACAYPLNKWLIMGTRGGLRGTRSSLRWKYFDPESLPHREVETDYRTPDRSYNWEEFPLGEETWHMPRHHLLIDKIFGKKFVPHRSARCFYEELYGTLRQGAPLAITPESVRRVMRVIEKCLETN